jgi:type I restriction enzyme R subunit
MSQLFRRRRLPHWDVPGATYFVTTCLAGSIPALGLVEIERTRRSLARLAKPDNMSKDDWTIRKWKQLFVEYERWLDEQPAVRHLADERLAKIVVDAITHFAGERYELWSYVVMPSHMHWVFRPIDAWEKSVVTEGKYRSGREAIVKSINGYSGRCCNAVLQKQGPFWQWESYDHWIRDEDVLERVIYYVEGNPVKAKLVDKPEDWVFSSALDRIRWGIPFGRPIVPPRGVGL